MYERWQCCREMAYQHNAELTEISQNIFCCTWDKNVKYSWFCAEFWELFSAMGFFLLGGGVHYSPYPLLLPLPLYFHYYYLLLTSVNEVKYFINLLQVSSKSQEKDCSFLAQFNDNVKSLITGKIGSQSTFPKSKKIILYICSDHNGTFLSNPMKCFAWYLFFGKCTPDTLAWI